jgi:hypothetical protein
MKNLHAGDLVYFREEWEDESSINESHIPLCSLATIVAKYETNDPVFSRNDEDISEMILLSTQHYGEIFVNNDERIVKFNGDMK